MLVRKFVRGVSSDSLGVRWPFVFVVVGLGSLSVAFPIHGVASHVARSVCPFSCGSWEVCVLQSVKGQDSTGVGPVVIVSVVMQENGTATDLKGGDSVD